MLYENTRQADILICWLFSHYECRFGFLSVYLKNLLLSYIYPYQILHFLTKPLQTCSWKPIIAPDIREKRSNLLHSVHPNLYNMY